MNGADKKIYIEQMNKSFAEQGVEAHFEDLKHFKGNIMQVLKMVDDFIKDLEKKLEDAQNEEEFLENLDKNNQLSDQQLESVSGGNCGLSQKRQWEDLCNKLAYMGHR